MDPRMICCPQPRTGARLGLLLTVALFAACGGGGGGGGDPQPTATPSPSPTPGAVVGDAARRAVLKDLGERVIVPALQDFDADAQALAAAVTALSEAPGGVGERADAQAAWREAMASWQRSEVLQVGPAGLSSGLDATPGGADLRDRIYGYPFRTVCVIEQLAADDVLVTAGSDIDVSGLGALEFLLFIDESNPCALDTPPTAQQRANYAASAASRIASLATNLRNRWEPASGNFLGQWNTAGDGSTVYARPQDALDALSVALFYTEKETKDRKISCPTGIGATGLSCEGSDVSRVEFPYARASTAALRANVQVFRDAFTGLGGGLGINDLLEGIEREDIAEHLLAELDATLVAIDALDPDFETEVEAIADAAACTNAASAAQGDPAACALHGQIKRAMDAFRTEVVAALSLATPDRAAGDND
jgi:predicted lipoprotein